MDFIILATVGGIAALVGLFIGVCAGYYGGYKDAERRWR